MKKRMIKNLMLVVVMVVLCMAVGMTASAENRTIVDSGMCGAEGDNVIWTLYDDGEFVLSGEGAMKDYAKSGYGVYSTEWYEYDISKVTIEDGITHLGGGSFYCFDRGEYSFTTIEFPESVKSIGMYAFGKCKNLLEFSVPSGATEIGAYTFYGCENLEKVYLPDSLTSIGDGAFYSCYNLKNIDIPNSVNYIGTSAFSGCEKLEKIVIPYGVTAINNSTFSYSGLKYIIIPDSVTSIGDYAFKCCSNLNSINIPSKVTLIGSEVFVSCANLKSIVVDENNEYYSSDEFGVLFNKDKTVLIAYPAGCTQTIYTIPDGVTSIGESAFYYCMNLISVTIPDDVTAIYDGTFDGCLSIERLYIGKGLEFWDIEVFYNQVPNFTDVIVDEENPYFLSENGVLYNKDKTELIHYPQGKLDDTFIIPNTVKKIRDYAVYQTVYLEKVIIPDSVEEIGFGVFCYSYSLQEFHVGKNVKNIDGGAFHIGLLIGTSKEYPKLYIESPDAVFGDFAFGISESIITCDEDIFRAYVEGTKELSGIERAIALNEGIENITEIYWEERPYGTIYAHDESCSAVEYAKSMGIEYELVHFYGDWTYDYENMVRYRECTFENCEAIETENLETTESGDVEIIEPTDPDTDFTVDVIEDYVAIEETISNNITTDFEIVKAFDINLKNKDGVHVQPDGTVKVKLPLDWSKDGVYKVYRVNDDGTLTDMNAYREGSHMVFDTDHFSIYVIVDESEKADEPIAPDEPQEETKDSFFSKLIDLIKAFFELIASMFKK